MISRPVGEMLAKSTCWELPGSGERLGYHACLYEEAIDIKTTNAPDKSLRSCRVYQIDEQAHAQCKGGEGVAGSSWVYRCVIGLNRKPTPAVCMYQRMTNQSPIQDRTDFEAMLNRIGASFSSPK